MSEMLLQTKLFVPPRPRSAVQRARLIERLDEGWQGKLILISAPAGFGKTGLVASWLLETRSGLRPERCAWLSLDESDNEVTRFFAYCLGALQRVQEGFGEAAFAAFLAPDRPPIHRMLTGMLNELAGLKDPAVLVLDDYHYITEPAVHDSLLFLLDNLPPSLKLIISTRADPPWPLARLRAGGTMTELRANDLRFTGEETAAFLNDAMKLGLSVSQVTDLDRRVEGWIAGLQLAALSMRGQQDVSGFIDAFTGSHRYVIDYLAEEVLNRQSPGIQDFLLKTSVLDRLFVPLCDAVLERDDSQLNLAELERANLFLIPLDEERRWYRYHRLFSDLLRSQLEQTRPELAPALRLRASRWFEQQGLLAEAVSQAQAADDVDHAIRLVERNALAMGFHGQLRPLLSWLNALPEGTVELRPWLSLAYAWVLAFAGRLNEVEPVLLRVKRTSVDQMAADQSAEAWADEDLIEAHVLTARAFVAASLDQFETGVALARQALESLSGARADDLLLRGMATMIMGIALRMHGEYEAASRTLSEAVTLSRAKGDDHLAVTALWETAVLEHLRGDLHQAYATCGEALNLGQAYTHRSGRPLRVTGYTLERVASIQYDWNDLETARRSIEESLQLVRQWGQADAIFEAYLTQSKILRASGHLKEARAAIVRARQVSGSLSPWYVLISGVHAALVHLAQGNTVAAERWLKQGEMSINDEMHFMYCPLYRDFARVLIGLNLIPDALHLLARVRQVAETTSMNGVLIVTLSIQAAALEANGQKEKALATVKQALILAEPGGFIRPFVDAGDPMLRLLKQAATRENRDTYANRLLAAFHDDDTGKAKAAARKPEVQSPAVPPLLGPLTDRELEVLRMLTTSLSSAEIARELFIAPSTVRSHIKRIYAKLDVHNRIEAIQRAHEIDLL